MSIIFAVGFFSLLSFFAGFWFCLHGQEQGWGDK